MRMKCALVCVSVCQQSGQGYVLQVVMLSTLKVSQHRPAVLWFTPLTPPCSFFFFQARTDRHRFSSPFLSPSCSLLQQPTAASTLGDNKGPCPEACWDRHYTEHQSLCERNECRIWRGRGGWCKCKRQWIQKLLKWLGFSPPHPRCPVCRQEAVK